MAFTSGLVQYSLASLELLLTFAAETERIRSIITFTIKHKYNRYSI